MVFWEMGGFFAWGTGNVEARKGFPSRGVLERKLFNNARRARKIRVFLREP